MPQIRVTSCALRGLAPAAQQWRRIYKRAHRQMRGAGRPPISNAVATAAVRTLQKRNDRTTMGIAVVQLQMRLGRLLVEPAVVSSCGELLHRAFCQSYWTQVLTWSRKHRLCQHAAETMSAPHARVIITGL